MRLAGILFLASVAAMAQAAEKLMDDKLAAKAEVVVRARHISFGGADKYAWYKVRVIEVFKNAPGAKFTRELSVAAYSGKEGVPEGESTLYLERYSTTNLNTGLWKLVGGEASTGVSHARKP